MRIIEIYRLTKVDRRKTMTINADFDNTNNVATKIKELEELYNKNVTF